MTAAVVVDGEAPEPGEVVVTVTAFLDEDTTTPVGSGTRTVRVDGDVHEELEVTVPVRRAPFVDIDGVAACGLGWGS